jgi:hypothetical protein
MFTEMLSHFIDFGITCLCLAIGFLFLWGVGKFLDRYLTK